MSDVPAWAGGSLDLWAASMYAVQRDLKQPRKDASGAVKGGKAIPYLSLPALIDHLGPALKEHSMFFTQDAKGTQGGTEITTTVWTNAGPQWVTFGPLFMPHGADPQQAGSAITYGRRYHLLTIFGLAAEDDDGASASSSPARRDNDPTQEPASTGASGRDGAAEDVAGEQPGRDVGEASVPAPATHTTTDPYGYRVPEPRDKQADMDEFHPNKPHRMKPSDMVEGRKFCQGYGSVRCAYYEDAEVKA